MVSNPRCGWCSFKFGDFYGTPSYLTDVPIDLLEGFINYWENSKTLSIYFDEEGSSFLLVADPYCAFVIERKNKPELYCTHKTMEELTLELIDDIERDLSEWEVFGYYDLEEDKEDAERYKQAVNENLAKLKKIASEWT